jgi:hypothetical protein
MKRIITEMPYIKTEDKKVFDLEIELFKDGYSIIEFFEDIFAGRPVKDKYGNKIQLKTYNEKKELADQIKNTSYMYNQIVSKMNQSEKRMFDLLLDF